MNEGKGKSGGKPPGHWITVRGHGGVPHHIFVPGPRPTGMGHGEFASMASAKAALTRGVKAHNGPASARPHAVEGAQGPLAAAHAARPASLRALRGRATRGANRLNAAGEGRPAATHPSSRAEGRGTPERMARAAAIREGMAGAKSGAPGSVPYREARRNYLDALKPGLVGPKPAPAPAPAPAPTPTHPGPRPLVPRGTPERRDVAGRLREARRSGEGAQEARDLAHRLHAAEVRALPAHGHVMERVEQAHARLDARNGGTNFVKLRDLRAELADLPRPLVDRAIRELRLAGKFSLDSHEGLHGPLTRSEKRAAVVESGSRLPYISRRESGGTARAWTPSGKFRSGGGSINYGTGKIKG